MRLKFSLSDENFTILGSSDSVGSANFFAEQPNKTRTTILKEAPWKTLVLNEQFR